MALNNIEKDETSDIYNGIINLISSILKAQNDCQIILYGLLPIKSVPQSKIAELNHRLHEYIEKCGNKNLLYRDFSETVNGDEFFADNVHLSKKGYEKWLDDLKRVL